MPITTPPRVMAVQSISYTATSGGDTLFTLSGVTNKSGITVKDTVVTLTSKNLNKENVSVAAVDLFYNKHPRHCSFSRNE